MLACMHVDANKNDALRLFVQFLLNKTSRRGGGPIYRAAVYRCFPVRLCVQSACTVHFGQNYEPPTVSTFTSGLFKWKRKVVFLRTQTWPKVSDTGARAGGKTCADRDCPSPITVDSYRVPSAGRTRTRGSEASRPTVIGVTDVSSI